MTLPVTLPESKPARIELLPLAGVSLLAIAFSGLLAFGLGEAQGWGVREIVTSAAVGAAGCVAAGSALTLFILRLGTRRGAEHLGTLVIGAGMARMLFSVGLAAGVFVSLGLEKRTFWTSFLIASLVCLLVETAWGMNTARRLFPMGDDGSRTGEGAR